MRKDMNGIPLRHLLPPFSFFPPPPPHHNQLPILLIHARLTRSSTPICGFSRPETLVSYASLVTPQHPTLGSFGWTRRPKRRWKKRRTHLRASRRESPYEVLGVSPSSTPQDIKRAYRRLALKHHPDVNKEANAQEKFMRIKHAYNTLLNSESRLKTDFSNRRSDYSNSTSERNKSWKSEEAEEFYGFEDFFRDLQSEFQNWEASAGSQEKPKSLWEELADIGEEFVEFLEKELNISDSNFEVENGDIRASKGNQDQKLGTEKMGDNVRSETKKESSIKENIDEIEAALAQLRKELGL